MLAPIAGAAARSESEPFMIPSLITAGTTFRVELELPEYPAPQWAVTLFLRGQEKVDLPAVGFAEVHVLGASAEVTRTWLPGRYWWALRATDETGDVVEVASGEVRVQADLASVYSHDGRSHAVRVLDAIEAVIEGRASKDQQSYQINNRQLSLTPIGDLLKLRDRYKAEAARERAGSNAGIGRKRLVRF